MKCGNIPSKSNKQKKIFGLQLEGHWRKEQDPDPERNLLVKGTDLEFQDQYRYQIVMDPEHYKKRALSVSCFWPNGAHSGEGVHGLKPLVDGLRQQAGKLLVVEDFQVAP